MARRLIVTIIAAAALLILGSGRIAAAAERAAATQPGGATVPRIDIGGLGGAALLVRVGAVIDGVMLERLDLDEAVKAKARLALRNWYVAELAPARKRVQAELAGADAAQRVHLKQVMKDFSTPYRSPQTLGSYVGARAALKDILTAEQLRKLDGLVQTATSEMIVNHYILDVVAGWKKDKVKLTADQQAKVGAIIATSKVQSGVLSAGDEVGVRQILNRLGGDLEGVLTPAQRIQVMHLTP